MTSVENASVSKVRPWRVAADRVLDRRGSGGGLSRVRFSSAARNPLGLRGRFGLCGRPQESLVECGGCAGRVHRGSGVCFARGALRPARGARRHDY